MNITSGKNSRMSAAGKVKIKEMPRCLCPAGIAVYSIPVEKIKSAYEKKRSVYPPESIAALAQSIHKYGVIHPLTVRATSGGEYELLCGERRLRAVRLLGHSSVNCIVISRDEGKSDAIALCEDMQREELHFTDIAIAIGKLVKKYSLDCPTAAAKLCLSESYVAQKLRLLEYTTEQLCSIRDGGISERQALSLLSVEDEKIRARMLCEIIKNRFDERLTDELVFAYLKKKLKKTPPKHPTCLIRDVRVFYNTVDRAIDVMRHAGYDIRAQKEVEDGTTHIMITIPSASS